MYGLLVLAVILILIVCVSCGSVAIPLGTTARILMRAATGRITEPEHATEAVILLTVRLPRVLCVALTGASLSVCGAAMQGLLKNPLADGSTLGVSSGASLGAVLAIVCGISFPGFPLAGTAGMAMLAAFLSILMILSLAFRLDRSLSTTTIILVGVVYSMFASSVITFLVTFASERIRSVTFWMMGSLSGTGYTEALVLLSALIICGGAILLHAEELNAFAISEENARHIGIPVRRVRLAVLLAVSALIGICVSIGGSISFVGLVTPHMIRAVTGPNHRRLLPACVFFGAGFLMLADLVARVALSPIELPIGAVTSLVGAVLFVWILMRSRRNRV